MTKSVLCERSTVAKEVSAPFSFLVRPKLDCLCLSRLTRVGVVHCASGERILAELQLAKKKTKKEKEKRNAENSSIHPSQQNAMWLKKKKKKRENCRCRRCVTVLKREFALFCVARIPKESTDQAKKNRQPIN